MEEQNLNPEPASPEAEQPSAGHALTDCAAESCNPEVDAVEAEPSETPSAEPLEPPLETAEAPIEGEPEPPAEIEPMDLNPEIAAKSDVDSQAADGPAPEPPSEAVSMEELLGSSQEQQEPLADQPQLEDSQLRAVLEAIIYVAEEPLTLTQISAALNEPAERIRWLLTQLIEEFDKPEHGLAVREVAGGFKMTTKPEHHEAVRDFVKSLKPPLKLSLPALETLAVIAYKQPVTAPEIMDIRGVQGAGVIKTLLDRKLIATAGRKNVIGKPILYKTTKEFMIQFGLKDLAELPSLKEFEELRRLAVGDSAPELDLESPAPEPEPETRPLPLVEEEVPEQ
jgi:segregation and condensation protein B